MHGCIYAAAATAGRDTGDGGDLSQEQPSWRDTSDDLGLTNISFSSSMLFTVGADAELRFAHKGFLLPGPFKFWLKGPLMEN